MAETKYMMSGGLAFAEEKDMEKLHRYSLEGWHVKAFKFMGYTLEKGEETHYIYSIDYRTLEDGDADEYFSFFQSAGWTHVASDGAYTHLFRAAPGTQPIYSDSSTKTEKYKESSRLLTHLVIPLLLVTALLWVGTWLSAGTLQTILLVLALIVTAIAIPAVWTTISALGNKWEVEGKKTRVYSLKAIPILILATLITILFTTNVTNEAVNMVIYMVIGAIALPTAIWMTMSLYHKIRKQ